MNVHIRKRKSTPGKTRLFLEVYSNRTDRKYESLDLAYDRNTPPELKKTIMEAAKRKRHERETQLLTGTYELDKIKKQDGSFIKYFDEYAETKKKSGQAFHNYTAVAMHLNDYADGKDYSFKQITEEFLEGFKNYLVTKVKPNTVNNYLNKLSAAIHKAVREKRFVYNPLNGLTRPKAEEVERVYLTEEEIKVLIRTECHYNEVKRAYLFACFTGMRFSDVKKLTWSEIREEKIHFRQKKTGGFEYVPLSETAKNIIYKNNPSKIIPLPSSKVFKMPVNHRTNSALLMWATKARIEKHITFHSSRHTFATLAITKGADLYTVSKLLGHKDISTTQIYAKIVNEKLTDAMKALPVFNVAENLS